MKRFSKITGQNVGKEPEKKDLSLNEQDVFKFKVMKLMDDFLKVQMYGPITRYHVAGSAKVSGKEIFLEALMDLLDGKDQKVFESGFFGQVKQIKSFYNRYSSDPVLMSNQLSKSIMRITKETAEKRYKACEMLMNDNTIDRGSLLMIREAYFNKSQE